jgi:hypothetical protein
MNAQTTPGTQLSNYNEIEARVVHTPPRWRSWRRFLALLLGILGLALCHDLTYTQIRDYYSKYPFSIVSVVFNAVLLWPLIPTYVGFSNCIGAWGYVNRIVIAGDKTTLYLLGPIGRESRSIVLDAVVGFQKWGMIGLVNGKKEDFFIKRKYLTPALKTALMNKTSTRRTSAVNATPLPPGSTSTAHA